tara:strand:- start:32852 stop:34996 length:2145 start_codon:yes stop_codon:yes gene_type:complete
MKQLIQSYKTGELGVYEVPAPICGENGVLVRTKTSLVSAGTEKMIVDLAKKSLLGKAKARPDLVKQVVNKMKQEGVVNTLEKVFTKLDTPIPLGYSCVGEVVQVGSKVTGVSVGDRVACGGAGYANHSEINYVPRNLFVKVPKNVSDADASFVTVGSIALQGIRQTAPTLGEKVVVMGLGLLGQISVQLLKANGCKVLGTDLDSKKLELAKKLGADEVCSPNEVIEKAKLFTNGNGADAVIIAASTSSNQPIIDAGEISRMKGRVVVVGLVGMDIPRNEYYKKELELKLSMAYGPGRYDPKYEEQGIDYPFAHVRWTEQRNFEAFLDLVDDGRVTPSEMVTHEYEFDSALTAYDLLEGKIKEDYLGILLNYKEGVELKSELVQISDAIVKSGLLNVGLVGAGNFTKSVILPNLKKVGNSNLVGLCTATGVSAHSTGNKHEFKYITTDYQELLSHDEINTVFITTRHDDHGQKVLNSLKAGKHVFVEKPLAIYEHELEEIKSFYSDSAEKPILQVGYNRRFAPLVQEMQKTIKGLPVSINYRVNAGVIPKDVWIQDPEVGGGRIIGEVCHFIDTCTYLADALPESVFAACVTKPDQSIPDEDNVTISIKYSNGSTAVINYYAFGNSQLSKEYVEVFAPDIAMKMDNFRELEIFKGNKSRKLKSANQNKGFKGEFMALKKAIEEGRTAITFDELYSTSKVTFAILNSLKTGEPQKL